MNLPDENADGRVESIWSRLVELPVAKEYAAAFETATGLALKFVPVRGLDDLQRVSGPFCTMLGPRGVVPIGCARKARIQHDAPGAHGGVCCVCCVADVTEVVVPVAIGGRHVGNLAVGPFCLRRPDAQDLVQLTILASQQKARGLSRLRADLLGIPVITEAKYRATATLAGLFAQHLSDSGNKLLLQAATEASGLLQKVRRVLHRHGTDVLPLPQLAREVGLSASRFCRQFKHETGLTLGEYRLRQRIEAAKSRLLDRQARVCEAAFAAGFGSIPHFNRAFRKLVGCAPSEYRRQATAANEAKPLTIQA